MPDWEVAFAFLFWCSGVFYAIYEVFKVGEYFKDYEDVYGDFKDGWLVTRKRDSADPEYEMLLAILQIAYPWLIANAFVSECLRYKEYKVIPLLHLIVGLTFTLYVTGLFGTFLILQQPLLFYVFYKFRRKMLFIWACSWLCLVLVTYFKALNLETVTSLGYNEIQHYYFIMVICWTNLRCLSYYLDFINDDKTKLNLLEALAYFFYLPTLFLGPFISFSSYERSKSDLFEQTLLQRISSLVFNIARFGTWFIVTEYFLHYVYVNALSFQPEVLHQMNSWALYGFGYSMGQFFHLKYVIFYGVSTSLAKFEHIIVPATPKCIGRIHLYSDMWRYFDVGLYKFLIRYIYLPSLRSSALMHKMLSSLLCFGFVYVWHGVQTHILLWAFLNFTGIMLENVFSALCALYKIQNRFGQRVKRRLLCIITSPLLAVSALSNFYFFAGMEVGSIFTERLLFGPRLSTAILLFLLTCCCYVSTEVKQKELGNNTQKETKNK